MLETAPTSRPRTLHLIDVENLMGTPNFTQSQVRRLCARYMQVAAVHPTDQFVVACSHHCAPAVWFGWRPARRLLRSGANGADLALIDVISKERVAERFPRTVVGSGDGIFADACARLQAQGSAVTVVSRCPSTLSKRLRFAALDLRFLEPPAVPAIAARWAA